VPRRQHDAHLLELAKSGVQNQLNDLVHEIRMLFDLFPHVRDSVDSDELPLLFLLKQRSQAALQKPSRASSRTSSTAKGAGPTAPKRTRKKAPKKT